MVYERNIIMMYDEKLDILVVEPRVLREAVHFDLKRMPHTGCVCLTVAFILAPHSETECELRKRLKAKNFCSSRNYVCNNGFLRTRCSCKNAMNLRASCFSINWPCGCHTRKAIVITDSTGPRRTCVLPHMMIVRLKNSPAEILGIGARVDCPLTQAPSIKSLSCCMSGLLCLVSDDISSENLCI